MAHFISRSSRATRGTCFCRILLLAAFFVFSPPVSAQVATGTPPFGSFGGGPDFINLANLNAHITVPMVHKAGRGGFNFTYDLSHDTSVWYPVGSSGSQSWQPVYNWGWRAQTEVNTGFVSYNSASELCGYSGSPPVAHGTHTWVSNYVYHDPWGVPHPFAGTSNLWTSACIPPGTNNSVTATATDGSGYTLNANMSSGTVTSRSGAVFSPPFGSGTGAATGVDRNGNEISVNSGGVFTDTLGTTALTVGGSGSPASPNTFTYTAPSGAAVAYKMNYIQYTVKTYFNASGIAEYGPTSVALVSSIVLPDNSQYTFNYEATPSAASCTPLSGTTSCVTGRITNVTLPTGGQIRYSYSGGNNGIFSDGSTATLTRATPDGTWTYARTMGSGAASTTTITDPQGNATQIQFQGIYETERKVYQGSSTSGTLLLTTDTCYNGGASPCTATAITQPISQRTVITTLPNNLQSKHFDSFSAFGMPTESDDYDYGSGAPGALLLKTTITYASLGNIAAFQQVVTVYNGGGTQIAQTTYNYDETTPTATSGLAQHVAAPSSRGNLTSVNQWVNTTSTNLTSHTTYYDTGTVSTATAANGAVSTYNYPDTTSTCADAFAKSVNEPMSMSRSFVWNCTGGVLTSVTDENNQPTTTTYNDPYFWRPANQNFPDGGQTSWTYNSPTSVTTTTKMNSSQNIVSTTLLDGLARVSQAQLTSDPQGTDYTVTTYDALGRISAVYNPTRCNPPTTNCGESTWGSTSYQYDALGRTTQVTNPDGSTALATYTGRATQIQDEGNGTQRVTRISQIDALGRTASVCEISSTTLLGNGATPAACGLDISATGFLTTYQYDVLGNLLQVNQAGLNSRSFSYDSLSRLVCASNPENSSAPCPATANNAYTPGTTGYSYDATGNLHTKTSPAPNQTGTATIALSYCYDALNRIVSKAYSAQSCPMSSPTASYTYDVSTVDGLTITNPTGRLVKAATADGKTATVNSYDQMGRVQNQWQCTPQNCGSGYFSLPLGYDLGGDITSAGNGAGTTFGYGYNGAAELNIVTSSLSDANHPATLLSSTTYTPVAALASAQLGNGATERRAYNSRLWLQSSSTTDPTGGTATPGSGSVTIGGPGEQSIPGAAATPASGSVTISGTEGSHTITNSCCHVIAGRCESCQQTIYDTGTVTITVNGTPYSTNYGQNSTATNMATALQNALNVSTSPVTASINSSSPTVINITTKGTGSAVNYSLSTSCSGCDFSGSASGSVLTGGKDAGPPTYDSGTVSITVNGYKGSYKYGQNDSGTSIASGLASALGPSSVNASASGNVVTMTTKTTGAATNYPLSTSVSYDTSHFSAPSFTATPSGTTLTPGSDNVVYSMSIGSYAPNGNMLAVSDSVNGNWTYGYDPFDRLTCSNLNNGTCATPTSGTPTYTYDYDRFGNRWHQNGPHSSQLGFDANNHIVGSAVTYDAAGNVSNDGSTAYTYDAENRVIAATNSTSGTSTYLYDAFGRRARKTTAAGSVDFLYDLNGYEIAEVSSTGTLNRAEIYAGARHLATYANGTTYFNHTDGLGTERMRTNVTGGAYESCTSLPFGDTLTCSNTDPSPMHFTGDERDSETGLDHTHFRQYTSSLGRWITPDRLRGSLRNPQSLNRYAYVLNNPANLKDPTGLNPAVLPPGLVHLFGGAWWNFGCTINGMDTPCGMLSLEVQFGQAVPCPNNTCSGVSGNGQFLTFRAFADGSAGYLPLSAPAGYSVQDIANAVAAVAVASAGNRIDPNQLTGPAHDVYDSLKALGVSPENIAIYQEGSRSFSAVLTDAGFDQLQQSKDVASNFGDAFLHYPYTDGGRSDEAPSLHYVWFDQNLTDYVGGTGVYLQFHSDTSNPYNGGFWQHWGCDVFHLTCQ
jgi:RHS repeat-associated protein